MSNKMFGVVLWADLADQKAVIWCEDHGDLAYWHDPVVSQHDGISLDVGDLVQFDMMEGAQLRHAMNPERLESKQFFGLAQSLRTVGPEPRGTAPREAADGSVVLFPGPWQREKNVA
ncbi:hypothetical protein PVT71_12240 [Salipiger sp. H15]|uniref:Uncharacterized protein n=1 Tax=Alloyangia sp. H15 TaxID=3029062 RepID=A0AAU8AER9_9RHOB